MTSDFTSKNNKNKKTKIIFVFVFIFVILSTATSFFIFKTADFNPVIKMVSGTEYISGEEGQIIIRISDKDNLPINGANCKASVLYPDKSFLFTDRVMTKTTIAGNYYLSFITPSVDGIYEEHINCEVLFGGVRKTLFISSSFHVSAGLNLITEISRSQRRQYDELINQSNITQRLLEQKISNMSLELAVLKIDLVSLRGNISNLQEKIHMDINETIKKQYNNMSNKFAILGQSMSTIFTS